MFNNILLVDSIQNDTIYVINNIAYVHLVISFTYNPQLLYSVYFRVRFRTPLGEGFFSVNIILYHLSLLSILGHCLYVVSLDKALHPQMLHLTQVLMTTR